MGKEVGKVIHFFEKVNVAVIELKEGLNIGDKIHIIGSTTDFEQKVDSMQIEHKSVDKCKKGEVVGLKVSQRVRPNDLVFLSDE